MVPKEGQITIDPPSHSIHTLPSTKDQLACLSMVQNKIMIIIEVTVKVSMKWAGAWNLTIKFSLDAGVY